MLVSESEAGYRDVDVDLGDAMKASGGVTTGKSGTSKVDSGDEERARS